jgi:hypothetical protein
MDRYYQWSAWPIVSIDIIGIDPSPIVPTYARLPFRPFPHTVKRLRATDHPIWRLEYCYSIVLGAVLTKYRTTFPTGPFASVSNIRKHLYFCSGFRSLSITGSAYTASQGSTVQSSSTQLTVRAGLQGYKAFFVRKTTYCIGFSVH